MDNNNIDFKDLWKKQSISQPNLEDLMNRLNHFKKSSIRALWKTNIMLIATAIFILCIWYYFQPEFISTKIGIVVVIMDMVLYLLVYNKLLGTYKAIDDTQSNQEYVQKLILIRKKQRYLQTKVLSWYFVLLGVGISLYMYEYAVRMDLMWAIFTYAVTFIWLAFNWVYIRPKQIKKHQTKINSLIEKFEEVNKQLEV
jgi:membrane protein YdbS with pleckstrin-like domain